jgi:two-component system sensor kinase FixL
MSEPEDASTPSPAAAGEIPGGKTRLQAWASAERSRARVGLALSLWIAAAALLTLPLDLVRGRWPAVAINVSSLALALIVARLFRRPRPGRLPALLLLGWVFALISVIASTEGGLVLAQSPWAPLLALFALYMLGPRQGLIFTALAMIQAVLSHVLHHTGATLPLAIIEPWDSRIGLFNALLATGLIALLGYVYETTQRRTMIALEDALVLTEQSEHQLDALIESTTAAICSLDRDQRLVTCNRAFGQLVAAGARPAPRAGDALAELLPEAQRARWQPHIERLLGAACTPGDAGRVVVHAEPAVFEEPPPPGQDAPHRETTMHPMVGSDHRVAGVTVFSRDITERKRSEAELRRLNQDLMRISREAGMAAVASEVLHNAGNVLNSTGVSVAMLQRHLAGLRVDHLTRAVAMLDQHADDLDAFVRDDPRGKPLLALLRGLGPHFEQQRQQLDAEVTALQGSIEHLTRVIHAQQSHARALGVLESVSVDALVEEALELQGQSSAELGIALEREIPALPRLYIDKHKAIEILVNLVGNARHALRDSGRPDKRLRVRAEAAGDAASGPERVRIHIEDNGVGIDPKHRDELFRLGFTTKRNGSGIGLHSSANAAQQLGGSITFHSDGPGQGARFTLELPCAPTARPPGEPGEPDEPDEPGDPDDPDEPG